MKPLLFALLAISLAGTAWADEGETRSDPPQENVQHMRALYEQARAEQEAHAQRSTLPSRAGAAHTAAGTIPVLHGQMLSSFQRMADQSHCRNVEVKNNKGAITLICGHNAGVAESADVDSRSETTITGVAPVEESQ